MLLSTILFPMLAGTAVSLIPMERRRRHILWGCVLLLTDVLGGLSLFRGRPARLFPLTDRLDLFFTLDGIGRFFLCAVLVLYTAAVIYALEYMTMEENEEQFFAFLFISFGAVIAACCAGNLVTFYLCFEAATLTTVPLVLHEGTAESVTAALMYLFYSIGGALLGLMAVMTVCWYAPDANGFVPGGFLGDLAGQENLLRAMVFCGVTGFGSKAGMYPLHGWLPAAHPIAPAPASALLSGIIAKMGILAVIRLVYFSAGPDLLRGSWAQIAWMILAMITIFMGSMTAFREKVVKKRLAYSSISQISYIMLGLSLLSEGGVVGGLLHMAAHAAAKGTLFLCAGVFIYRLGIRKASDLRGVGKFLPVTMWCFLISSLSLVGIPPMGGFVSKWIIALSAVGDGMGVLSILPVAILLISALLTAGYLLPVVIDAFFPVRKEGEPAASHSGAEPGTETAPAPVRTWKEPSLLMTGPLCALSAVSVCVGVFGSGIAVWLSAALQGVF